MNLNSKKIEIIERLIKIEDREVIYAIEKLLSRTNYTPEVDIVVNEEKEKEVKNQIEIIESNPHRFITKSMIEEILYKKKP